MQKVERNKLSFSMSIYVHCPSMSIHIHWSGIGVGLQAHNLFIKSHQAISPKYSSSRKTAWNHIQCGTAVLSLAWFSIINYLGQIINVIYIKLCNIFCQLFVCCSSFLWAGINGQTLFALNCKEEFCYNKKSVTLQHCTTCNCDKCFCNLLVMV